MKLFSRQANLFTFLILLSMLLIFAQCALFAVHYSVASLCDYLAKSPLFHALLNAKIILPLISFIFWQLCAYFIVVVWAWFSANEIGGLFNWKPRVIYLFGILIWLIGWVAIFSLNQIYYPTSFFAQFHLTQVATWLSLFICFYVTLLAFINTFFLYSHNKKSAWALVAIIAGVVGPDIYSRYLLNVPVSTITDKPDIIIIGIDSLRPDFIHESNMPHLSNFLTHSAMFSNAFTPLARTFPSWVSILTGRYPINNGARINLEDESVILRNPLLGKRLQAAGYYSMYGTDEPRFTDIGEEYGFDRIIGPKGKAAEFIVGSFSDFPITNLLSNAAIGSYLFPYNYANRAADYAYEPDNFLQLIKYGLAQRPVDRPLFLALHLCLSHWPYSWAQDRVPADAPSSVRYANSVAAVDAQFGKLIAMLDQAGLLQNSLVVVLSDHGVTVGLPHDRLLDIKNYQGAFSDLHRVASYKLSSAADLTTNTQHDITINTSYGQGTDIASRKQYNILLGFRRYGEKLPAQKNTVLCSTLDITPTILDFLKLPPVTPADGMSLISYLRDPDTHQIQRPFFMETGDTIADMVKDKIFLDKIVKNLINGYNFDPKSGRLFINPEINSNIISNKERAVMFGDWMLIRYPYQTQYDLKNLPNSQSLTMQSVSIPPYYLLINLKTKKWTIGLNDAFAKQAPVSKLLAKIRDFYYDEFAAGSVPSAYLA